MKLLYTYLFYCCLSLSCNNKTELKTDFNERASITTANKNPLNGIAINVSINSEEHTVSMLYGNETAARYVRLKNDGNYPRGSILSMVTWKQTDDPRWFGANIPDSVLKVEILNFDDSIHYSYYSGKDMQPLMEAKAENAILRMRSQRSLILP